jgi:hypothetical protein
MTKPLRHKRISSSGRSIADLVHSIEDGDLILDPPYQRGDVWTEQQRVNLIKSIMLGIPIAAIVLNKRGDNRWWDQPVTMNDPYFACIDGKQRLTTVRMWMNSEFAVPGHWFEKDAIQDALASSVYCTGGNVYYSQLSLTAQRFFRKVAILPVSEAMLRNVTEEAEVYDLINSAGTSHTKSDLDRARLINSNEVSS